MACSKPASSSGERVGAASTDSMTYRPSGSARSSLGTSLPFQWTTTAMSTRYPALGRVCSVNAMGWRALPARNGCSYVRRGAKPIPCANASTFAQSEALLECSPALRRLAWPSRRHAGRRFNGLQPRSRALPVVTRPESCKTLALHSRADRLHPSSPTPLSQRDFLPAVCPSE